MKRNMTYTVAASKGLAAMYAKRALPTLWQVVVSQLVLQEPEEYHDKIQYWNHAITALINLRINAESLLEFKRRNNLALLA